jgi:hypothetical protein
MIIVPKREIWTRQPQIGLDESDLAPGRIWACVSVGAYQKAFGTAKPVETQVGSGAAAGIGQGGKCLNISTVGDYLSYGANDGMQLSASSGIIVFDAPAGAFTLFTTSYSANGGDGKGFCILITSAGHVEVTKQDHAYIINVNNLFTADKLHKLAWSYNNVTGSARLAFDGNLYKATSAQTLTHSTVARGRYYDSSTAIANQHKQYLFALSPDTSISDAELVRNSINPWEIFKKRSRKIFLSGVGGGGATTVTGITGNAVAEGVAAKTNLSVVTTPANAVAEGVAAKTNLSVVTTPANAVAEGVAAKTNLSVATTLANAVAEGLAARTNLSLVTTPANAVASGVTAQSAADIVVQATVANAVAEGAAARTNLSLATTPANAVADGVAARTNRTLITTAANAVAEGVAAKTNFALVTTPANAVAAGVQASLDGSARVTTTPADAVGAGTTANVSLTLITSTGSAIAEGVTASLNTAITVTCTPADAVASGTTAQVNQAINCAAASAAAEGVTASLVVGGIDITITATAGDAVAEGVAADVVTMVTLVTTPANAVADGVSSSVSGPSYVTCSVANGVASGTMCLITVNVPFEAEVVNLRSALTKRVSLRSAL